MLRTFSSHDREVGSRIARQNQGAAMLRMNDGGAVYECDSSGDVLRLADANALPDLPWGDDLADDEIPDD